MKKIIFLILPMLITTRISALPAIPEDYYLNNSEVLDEDTARVEKILPNTLRLVLSEGESGELYAEVFPKDANGKTLRWSSLGDGIELYPSGAGCTVVAKSPGKSRVSITSPSGAEAAVEIEVKPKKIQKARTFEPEPEKAEKAPSSELADAVVVLLATGGVALILFGAASVYKMKGERDEDTQ